MKKKRKGITGGIHRCPYCGSPVTYRSSDGIYKDNSRGQCSMYVHITRNATHMCAFIQEQIFRWEQWRTESFVSSEMRHTNIFQN